VTRKWRKDEGKNVWDGHMSTLPEENSEWGLEKNLDGAHEYRTNAVRTHVGSKELLEKRRGDPRPTSHTPKTSWSGKTLGIRVSFLG